MRISDWSSDVCSSDLKDLPHPEEPGRATARAGVSKDAQAPLQRPKRLHASNVTQAQRLTVPRDVFSNRKRLVFMKWLVSAATASSLRPANTRSFKASCRTEKRR